MSDTSPEIPRMGYQELTALFQHMGTGQTPTSLHGSLSGVLAAGHRMSEEAWIKWALDLLAPGEEITEVQQELLNNLYISTLRELEDPDFTFKPLLPDDSAPLSDRLEALSDWCGSFLGAFGTVGVVAEGKALPEQVEEVLEDLSAIAQVETEQDEDDQAEEDYLAISEHVRMGVLTLFLEYNRPAGADSDLPTVH